MLQQENNLGKTPFLFGFGVLEKKKDILRATGTPSWTWEDYGHGSVTYAVTHMRGMILAVTPDFNLCSVTLLQVNVACTSLHSSYKGW